MLTESGRKRFSSVVQLLEAESGERLVRFAYTTGGSARRGPVTLRAREQPDVHAGVGRVGVDEIGPERPHPVAHRPDLRQPAFGKREQPRKSPERP